MKLWLFTALGPPCVENGRPGRTRCGRATGDAQEISRAQALVWYQGRLCAQCANVPVRAAA